jgi:hypothetical protein
VVLAVLSAVLLIAVDGNTQRLIPLFAIGVFTGFTLCQIGLVVHWWHERPPRWVQRAAVNGLGAVVTALSTVIFLVTKFSSGGWVVLVAVAVFIALFRRIHHYYRRVAELLGFATLPEKPVPGTGSFVIVPVTNISRLTAHALSEALCLGSEVMAVTVAFSGDDEHAESLRRRWEEWDPGVPLRVVALIDEEQARRDEQIVVLIPVVVPTRVRYRVLHNHLEVTLTAALRTRADVIVARVPVSIDPDEPPGTPVPGRKEDRGLSQ